MLYEEISENWIAKPCKLNVVDFFESISNKPFAFLYGDGQLAKWLILGDDPLFTINDPKDCLPIIHRFGDLPPIFPDFIGHISYEYGSSGSPFIDLPIIKRFAFPDCHFTVYRNLRLYNIEDGILYTARRSGKLGNESSTCIQYGEFKAYKLWDSDTSEDYQDKVKYIRQEIAMGNVYQVNLTRQECWRFSGDLRLFARRLFDVNPAPFSALIMESDFSIVSSSPERFFQINSGRILTSPIKGTAGRDEDPIVDNQLKRGLIASFKDRSELAMITDLMRNDLTKICLIPSVIVEEFPRLESYANVHHLVADISGKLMPNVTLSSLLAAIFPGGSITGCPKLAAMQVIRKLENNPRMIYTGALGWFSYDLNQADFNIPIRTVWASTNELLFGVGGGVVWDSDPHSEYQETVHKAKSIIQCLNY